MPKNMQPESILRSLKALTLSEQRRHVMRAELISYADLHAVASARPAVRSTFYTMRLWYGVTAFVLIILVGTGSAAYASDDTLPGDVLYPVKVAVVEPVHGALLATTEEKAQWHASLAERRLEEATKLAIADKLDEKKQIFLADQFALQVDTSSALADTVHFSGNEDTSLALHSDLEARITAHGTILSLVTEHLTTVASTSASTADTIVQARTLLMAVRDREHAVVEARLALERDADRSDVAATATIAIAAKAEPKPEAQDGVALMKMSTIAPVAETAPAEVKDEQPVVVVAPPSPKIAARQAQEAVRASEVASILLDHAALLKSIGIVATTTATTTRAIHIQEGFNATTTIQSQSTTTEEAASPKFWSRLVAPLKK